MSVPTSLLGLLLFVVLLWPGFVYSTLRGRLRPERTVSPLREVVSIVTASLTVLALTAVVFAVVRVLLPGHTPAVGALVRTPGTYAQEHYQLLSWWGAGLVLLALLTSAALAAPGTSRSLARLPGLRGLVTPRAHSSEMSAWWVAFTEYDVDIATCHVGCVLNDGGYYSGWLNSFSQAGNDGPDRDLTLGAPIRYRPAGETADQELTGVGVVVLSARQIATVLVTYVDATGAEVTQSASPASSI